MFGEVITWGPLGPGGFPAASLQGYSSTRAAYRRMTTHLRPAADDRRRPNLQGGRQFTLGALGISPTNQATIDKILAQLDTTELQVDNEIGIVYSNLGDPGSQPDAEKKLDQITARHEAVISDLVELNTATAEMADTDMPTFTSRADNAQRRMDQLLQELQYMRTGQYTSARIGGVLWGVGAMAAAGTTLWLLWRNRLRRQRR